MTVPIKRPARARRSLVHGESSEAIAASCYSSRRRLFLQVVIALVVYGTWEFGVVVRRRRAGIRFLLIVVMSAIAATAKIVMPLHGMAMPVRRRPTMTAHRRRHWAEAILMTAASATYA